jgi:hypothetical protein
MRSHGYEGGKVAKVAANLVFAIDRFDRPKGLGKRGKHGFTRGAELDARGIPQKQPTTGRLLKLANALTDGTRRERKLMRGLLHLAGARHGDEGLQQREASDHGASLARLNLSAKSIACRSAAGA